VLEYDFENSVGYWLLLAQQAYARQFNARLAPHGITYRQMQVLGWLAIEGQMTQADLAARMVVEPPSLVGVLDRMEQSGWIARQACPEDRRKKWIVPKPAAQQAWKKIVSCGKDLREQATKGLTKAETVKLRKMLAVVHENVATATINSNGSARR
jgi:MarR family transcriptional regulator for hemolysin